jgi:hypothetical protein
MIGADDGRESMPEFEDSRDGLERHRLAIEPRPIGRVRCGSLLFRVHRIADAGPYAGVGGRPVCILATRRRALYLVLETRAGRLIVFNIGDQRTSATPWSRSRRSPFGVIERADLAPFAASLDLGGPAR